MFDGRWRGAVDAKTRPVGEWLQRHGITADVLTATGLVSATLTAVAIATGHLLLAVFLLTLTGAHDLFDGPVAKAAGTTSLRGAFFDSVTDRVADAVLMGGVAWYLISEGRGHLAVLPIAILGVTALVSYERAKADALGLSAGKGGLMERAERMILLGLGLLVAPLLVPVLWALLVLTACTAVGRFVRIWRAASEVSPQAIQRGRATKFDARLREWRQRAASDRTETRSQTALTRLQARRDRERPERARRTTWARSSRSTTPQD
jgi:CDP-diacylglycerol--glycerol-3-phosphate 3-phosphatidyltransferase